jgi:hypothetical protein
MPSRLVLNPQHGNSTLDVSNAAQRVRNGGPDALRAAAEAIEKLSAEVQRLQRALRQSATMKSLSVESADIQDLTVGGAQGPGQLTVLSGPPDYALVGWDGTGEEAAPVDILTFNADTVTTDGPHGALVGHVVHIQGTNQHLRNGYFAVLTVPTDDTYTVANPGGANATGGTSTVQFSGGWRRQFAFGGDDYLDAPVFTDPQGGVYIGERGSISLLDALKATKGFLGIVTETAIPVTGAVDNGSGKVRLTVVAHGYEVGDDVVFTAPGVVAGPTDAMVTAVVDADHIDVDTAFAGTYTTGGDAYRYRGPFWGATIALGKTGYSDAIIRTFRDGSARIGVAGGARLEISAAGALSLVDAGMTITDAPVLIEIDGTNGVKVTRTDTTPDQYAQMLNGQATISDGVSRVLVSIAGIQIRYSNGTARIENFTTSGGAFTEWYDSGGTKQAEVDTSTGFADFQSLRVGNTEVVDSAQIGKFSAVHIGGTQVLTTQQGAIADVVYTPNAGAAVYNLGKDNLLFALLAQINALTITLRTHGIIAT